MAEITTTTYIVELITDQFGEFVWEPFVPASAPITNLADARKVRNQTEELWAEWAKAVGVPQAARIVEQVAVVTRTVIE